MSITRVSGASETSVPHLFKIRNGVIFLYSGKHWLNGVIMINDVEPIEIRNVSKRTGAHIK